MGGDRKKIKAISLMSGGLDSTLATKIVKDIGIEILALNFTSPFCTCTSHNRKALGCKNEALRIAHDLGIAVRLLPKGREYIQLIRNPKYGYGSAMNPCIDCRIFMFRKAKEVMEEVGASFIITGEVLGQRPMSQRRDTMLRIEKEAGLTGLIIRPLSAKHLEPTAFEREGIVDRERLLAVKGRSRNIQIQLAAEYNINDYPCPAGGCLLTDRRFAEKLKDYFLHNKDDTDYVKQMELLKIGRHFRLPGGAKVILGRESYENERLVILNRGEMPLIEGDFPGPVALLDGEVDEGNLSFVVAALTRFNKKAPKNAEYFIVRNNRRELIKISRLFDGDVTDFQIGIDR